MNESNLAYFSCIGRCFGISRCVDFIPTRVETPKKPTVPERKPQWYLVNRATDQVSTAYTELQVPGFFQCSSLFHRRVSVHPKVPGGSHLDP
jgi:hypothetical protein